MIEKIAHKLTRRPRLVALTALLMLIPSVIGYAATRINYDILSYLPQDLPSSQGEQLLEEPFQMAATSMLIVEGMPAGYTNRLIQEVKFIFLVHLHAHHHGIAHALRADIVISRIFKAGHIRSYDVIQPLIFVAVKQRHKDLLRPRLYGGGRISQTLKNVRVLVERKRFLAHKTLPYT